MSPSFEDFHLSPELLQAVKDMGFEEPSPIQVLAVPFLLTGRDAVGQAQTGTGKTAAFGMPILEKLTPTRAVQSLVLCPTRELAIQVAEELSKLAARMRGVSILPIYGGQAIERQLRALERGVQVVVGTPGRVMDHLQRGTLRLGGATTIVLDEADEMLDMGFREDIEAILERVPAECQRVLFSATMPPAILQLSKRFLREPEMLAIAQKTLTVPAIEQVYYEVRPHQKMDALCRVLDAQGFRKALVFCSTKRSVDEVTAHLQQRGYQSDGLHGDLAQSQRDRVMQRFRGEGLDILIATDVAARGIDVDDVDAVVNYDIPHDAERYVHRIGRTGRAGRVGKAFTFVTLREQHKLRDIIRHTKARIQQERLPSLRDVANIRTSRLLDEVRATLTAGALETCMQMVEDFLSEQFADDVITSRDVAAALLKLLMQRDFGDATNVPEEDPLAEAPRRFGRDGRDGRDGFRQGDRDGARPRRNDAPMTRLHISVGHAHKVSPGEMVGAITGECGIAGRSIGAISIQKHFSLVEVQSEFADDVLAVLNRGVFIAGTRVTAKLDTGGGSFQRKSFGPGPRAPRGPRPGYPARNQRDGGGNGGGGGKRFTHPDKWGRKPRGAEDDRD